MHLWLKKCSNKDYFGAEDASLIGEMSGPGLFFGCGCIPERRNVRARIIFGPVDASLVGEMPGQGLFLGRGYIPERRNAWIRIILGPGMHPWLDRVNFKS